MHIAAHYENLSVAQLLLNRGASVNFTPQVSAEWEATGACAAPAPEEDAVPPIHVGYSSSCQGMLVRWDYAESSTDAWGVAMNNQHGAPFCQKQPCISESSCGGPCVQAEVKLELLVQDRAHRTCS